MYDTYMSTLSYGHRVQAMYVQERGESVRIRIIRGRGLRGTHALSKFGRRR